MTNKPDMTDFTLDTSGAVEIPTTVPWTPSHEAHAGPVRIVRWPDLDAFTQGYVEALLKNLIVDQQTNSRGETIHEQDAGFSDLSPEALAMILADCAAWHKSHPGSTRRAHGQRLWTERQLGTLDRFPPLTVSLGDDGKVRLALSFPQNKAT